MIFEFSWIKSGTIKWPKVQNGSIRWKLVQFSGYTPEVEAFSIDESFLDVTGSIRLFVSAERIAYLIKARIKHQFGITCSVDIASYREQLEQLVSGSYIDLLEYRAHYSIES